MSAIDTMASSIATSTCWPSPVRSRCRSAARTPIVANNPDAVSPSAPMGALGDTASGLFATIGVLAALRHRERTGEGQHVDVAMLDAMVSMADIVPNFYSLGVGRGDHRK